jgi:ADP-heptose:LPS heptosyltransferase
VSERKRANRLAQCGIVLALRALGLGDLLTAVPAVRALRRAYPRHELVLATPPAFAPLVEAIGGVDRLLPTEAYVRAPIDRLRWPGGRPEIAVNLHGRGPQSHRALLAHRPRRLLAYASAVPAVDGPQWSDDEHEVVRWCRLLEWHGIAADPADLILPAPDPPGRHAGAVVLHPGASGPERCWPAAHYAALARRLAADGHRVLLTGGLGERRRAQAVARGAGLGAAAVLAGRTDIAALAATVAHAVLVVCGDTGVAHLATAYGTPSVVLFGPMTPARWGPPAGRARHVALWRGPAGLAGITPDEVLGAAGRLLGARGAAVR